MTGLLTPVRLLNETMIDYPQRIYEILLADQKAIPYLEI